MDFTTIRYETQGSVALLTLSRPDKLNAINSVMIQELHQAMDKAESDEEVRVIILQGEGRAFSAGFDINGGTSQGDITSKRKVLTEDFNIIMRFWDCPKPTISAIHKYCFGGALEMAMACDLTIASEECRLGEPEPKFGSGIVALLMPWMTGPKQAKQLLMTGDDRVTAKRAYEMGLVNEVTVEGQHSDAALKLARTISALDKTAIALTKQAINRSYEIMGMRQALLQALETDVVIETTETPESREFNDILERHGLKEALAWRENRYAG
ncbi:enoyl-CoA hydratase/isomerase family protein [Neptunomonas sp.]|uniref:enoyl-CoA hydratase/isomerase family protein n=1 Tax=Neptunomonas sp. TaxID=1971898 RepID=UPI003562F399